MDINQLRYFLAVADLGSFSKAAASCYVSQPSLSIQIQKLENELGKRLLNRTNRKVTPTEAGRILAARAKRILAEMESVKRDIQTSDNLNTGTVTFGVLPTIGPYFLPPVLQVFRERCPNIGLSVHEDSASHLLQLLNEHHLDFAIACPPIKESCLELEKLFSEELLLALSRQNPLSLKNKIEMEDLKSENFILIHEGNYLSDQISEFCKRHGFCPKMSFRTGQISTVQALVQSGMGVSLIPQMAATEDISKITYRALPKSPPKRTIAIVRPKKRQTKIVVEEFIQHLRNWKTTANPDSGDFAVGL